MKFLHRPVLDFEGITRNFEQLETIFTGLNAVRFGAVTVTWSGSSDSSSGATITHGLPSTPTAVIATANTDFWAFTANVISVGATTFGVYGQSQIGTPTAGTSTIYWLAIG